MKKLDHPNIIKLYEVIEDEYKDKIILVMEYAEIGEIIKWDMNQQKFFLNENIKFNDIESQSGFISENLLKKIFRECLIGLHYLHC